MKTAFFSLRPPRPLRFIFLLVLFAVSACGWRLQGAYTFPPQMARTYVQAADEYSPLAVDLRRALDNAENVEVVSSADEAMAVLNLSVNQTGQRVLSVDTSSLAREYEAYYRVVYSLVDSDGNILVPEKEYLLTRQYLYDQSDILAMNREAELLQENMQHDMVRLILRRLAAVRAAPEETGTGNARP